MRQLTITLINNNADKTNTTSWNFPLINLEEKTTKPKLRNKTAKNARNAKNCVNSNFSSRLVKKPPKAIRPVKIALMTREEATTM